MKFDNILNEIKTVLDTVETNQVNEFINNILSANTIVTIGAGRVGMAIKGFTMRLGHLGLKAFHLGDTSLPSIGENDILKLDIKSSGSWNHK